jgi:hypothetical protein
MSDVTTEPRRIEADTDAAGAIRRRGQLGWMLEDARRVRVTNPSGGSWTGRIVGLADHPTMLLERGDGHRVSLPQCFAVEQIPEDEGS